MPSLFIFLSGMLFAVSTYLVLSPHYDDGIIGKVCLSVLSISSYGVLLADGQPKTITVVIMVISLTGALLRDWIVFNYRMAKVKK